MSPESTVSRSGLSEAKRRLLEQRLRGRGRPGADRIPRRPDPTAPAPLSFAQRRLWFLDRLYPGAAAYNLPKVIRAEGDLDVPLLERVLGEIVARHEVLRTSLPTRDGEPVQVVAPAGPVTLPRVDLRPLAPEARRRAVRRLARAAAENPFDLARGPLWRARLLVLGPRRHVILLTLHHTVSDGWSSGVLVRELTALYTAFAAGEPSPLPPLPVQYADYAAWEREWLQGERLERQLDWWRRALDGVRTLELPTDHPRSAEAGLAGERLSFTLSAELSDRLKSLARREGTTAFVLLLAAWKVLIARTTGQDDVCVGTPVAGRGRKELEPLIGFFVNTLALRTRLAPAAPFRHALERVRQTVLGAQDHQETPFDRLVEELAPDRDLEHAPLFNVMFSFLPPVGGGLELPGLRLEPQPVESRSAMFELTLAVIERQGRFASSLEYRTELFEAETVQRLVGHWQTLLRALVADPDRAVRDLPLMDAAERRQLLEWGRPAVAPAPRDPGATHLEPAGEQLLDAPFRRRVGQTPDAPAVLWGDRRLSYGDLDRAADRLARRLVAAGVGPEVPVALCVGRSPALVVGLLAILRSGGVYVPLDPSLPEDRLAFLVADSGARVVVAGEGLVGPWAADLPQLSPGPDGAMPDGGLPPVPAGRTGPGNLAYLIYTSGSTGTPKGVAVPHGAAAAHCRTVVAAYGLGPEDRVLQFASSAFDVSIEQIVPTLWAGACLVLRGEEVLAPLELSRWLAERRITVANFPTALWHRWVDDPRALEAAPDSLRLVVAGGEEMRSAGVRAWGRCRLAGVPLLNGYGPTEAVITATLHQAGAAGGGQRVPIGRPLPGRCARVVDRWGGDVPVGVVGELLLGGLLARGYLGRRDLTAERFVPDPDGGGARLYRTGDRAVWRPDGNLAFLGRVDHQIKVRGFRVEPGEIESALVSHPEVGEAAVVLHPAGDRLVAYLVAGGERKEAPGPAELRSWLAERLPEYMVPALLVPLESLPLTPTGKVDRRALPEPEVAAVADDDPQAAAAGPVEEMLRGIWEEVLDLPRVPAGADFFALGGHSLLATRVVSRIRELFGVDLPLRRLFQRTRLDELAAEVESALGGAPAAPPIVPVPRDQALPASFAQQRLWFLDRLEPGQSAYNIFSALALHGRLDRPALRRSIAEIVRRHEVLRTTFDAPDGQPVQVVTPPGEAAPPVRFVDLAGLAGERREGQARRLRSRVASLPFDLERGPLFETLLLELGGGEHHLLVRMHHVVSDAWSHGLLVRELGRAYTAFAAGRPSPLEELEVQYADYAHWQRRWLQGEVLEDQLAYWRDRLAGAPAALDLVTDRPRPAVWAPRGDRRSVRLPAELVDGLRRLARRQGATLYMVLLTAFQALLHRYTGQDDLTVGSPIAGRNRREVEALIGFFVNTLVLRSTVDGDPPFDRMLTATRETALAAYEHQDVPFERLVEELVPERSLGRTPLFQVVFALETTGGDRLSLPDLELRPLGGGSRTAKFDLSLVLAEGERETTGWMEYPVALFDASTVERLLGHWRTLLSGVVESPEVRLSELPLLTAVEENQLLVEWTATATGYPREATIDTLFGAQARATPEAVAVEMARVEISGVEARATAPPRTSLTYGELDGLSTALAWRLRAAGVGPEIRVGLCVERSLALPVALLAILKAGGAFVPLDPDYPRQRLAFMMEDAGLAVLLAQESLVAVLPDHQLPVLLVDAAGVAVDRAEAGAEDGGPSPAGEVGNRPSAGTSADSLAYLMYTSGSTGRPNGVAVPHRGVVRLVKEADYADLGPEESFLQLAPISFDASTLEVWGPLLNGGRLVVMPPGAPSLADLERAITDHRVTSAWLTAGLFHQVVEERVESLGGLRQLLAGGDVLSPPAVRRFLEAVPEARLVNGYGPTENTTFTTCHPMGRPGDVGRTVPIGRPIADTTVHLVGRRMESVPVGVAGELWTGGDGLARGYWDRPARTGERFVPHPWSGEPGARLYRTGDLARWRPDGSLEFLGRRDFQFKIRGFRVELGEVEGALAELPGVADAVAVVRDGAAGKRLLVYVVMEAGSEPVVETAEGAADAAGPALRDALAERLPGHLVPSAVVVLDELPLTPNGKVDRRALPEPGTSGEERRRVAPRTAAEEAVAAIWSDLLGVGPLGVGDDFFALGGHSLLATRVVSRVADVFGAEVPLRTLFEHPTLEGFAATLAALESREDQPIERGDGPAPLSFAQQRLWFLDRLEPGSSAYNVPVAVRLRGGLDAPRLRRCLEEVVCRHEVLRSRFRESGEGPVQEPCPPPSLAMPLLDLSATGEQRREGLARRVARQEGRRPFDLGRLPLLRAVLLRLGPADHVLLVTLHHVVTDGWSMSILTRELTALYSAFGAGEPTPLAELPIQYADFARWQRRRLSGEVLEAEVERWRERLAGTPVLELPTDRPRPRVLSTRGAARSFSLGTHLSHALLGLAADRGVTPFVLSMAAFQVLLYRLTGQDDLAVGTPVAGRQRSELEELIGFFVNTLVLRADLRGDPAFADVLEETRERALEAFAHQEVPFERLVEELVPERRMDQTPLFQVVFAYQNAPRERLALGGVDLAPFRVEGTTAKFDLTMTLGEGRGDLSGSLEYRTELFDVSTVERLLGQWRTLLSGVVDSPQARLSELPLLTPAEQSQLLVEWTATATGYPRQATIDALFSEQVRATPGAVAVEMAGAVAGSAAPARTSLTYGELDAASTALAWRLRTAGVGPEVRVGLCVERSLALPVALLAVLKAGGAFVPLDADYPRQRLALMMEDAGLSVLLAQAHLAELLPEHDLPLLRVDADGLAEGEAETRGGPLPSPGTCADRLAYVMYTSGSTGRPNGVAVPHRGVVRLVRQADYADLGPECSFLQLAPISFDASTLEVWGPLLNGGRLVVLPPGAPSLAELERAITDHRVTSAWLTSGLFHQVVEERAESLGGLRQLLAGGDVLSPPAVRRFLETAPKARLINGYGPTENTTFTTCHPMDRPDQVGRTVPIGRPIADTTVFVAGRNQELVPVGVAGELWAGGDGLARGYWDRPAKTAERFVPHPWSGEPGARLYRTGDQVRWRTDGSLEFLGRLDFQFKIRGFRVELGEVEAALAELPGVAEAAAVVRDGVGAGAAGKRLLGYVTLESAGDGAAGGEPAPDADLRGAALRDTLAERLPPHLVPSVITVLDELPLSPTGKVDRRALPEPGTSGEERRRVAPRTAEEAAVASIWCELLETGPLSVDDDFFALGGHSLLAIRVVSRAADAFAVDLPLKTLFEHPTLEGFAAALAALERREDDPIERGDGGPTPLSFAQQRLWFLDRLEPGSSAYNVPVAVRLRGELDAPCLRRCLEEVVRRHEVLRSRFRETGEGPVQEPCPPPSLALPLLDLSATAELRREELARRVARQEGRRPFDLGRAPLLRAVLLRLGPADHVLLVTLHHVVTDGWSMSILTRELTALYSAFGAGEPSPLPELPIQYADFARWQRRRLSGEALEAEVETWTERLAGTPALELPTDRPRPRVLGNRGAARDFSLGAPLSRGLLDLAAERGVTPFALLMAAFQVLLHRYSGQEDLAVGTPVAGRQRSELEDLIGFFVNTLVLRADLRGDPAFADVLEETRQRALEAFAHQEVPFESLVEALEPERRMGRTPLFQVIFAFQNAPRGRLALGEVELAPFQVGGTTAKFDLTLAMAEGRRGLTGALEYRTELFDASTVERMLGHWRTLLAGVVESPGFRLSELPLLTSVERSQLLVEWTATETGYPRQATIDALFAAQERATPDAVAVEMAGAEPPARTALTYRELNQLADALAWRLRAAGVGPETRVGLCVERSLALPVALLAVLKAGGAFVPLDPDYPRERLALMMEDAGLSVLLAQAHLAEVLPEHDLPLLRVDAEGLAEGEAEPRGGPLPLPGTCADSLAYIMYTSGSTGRPNGVSAVHRGVVRLVKEADYADLGPEESFCQVAPISFDASTLEIWGRLLNGGRLVIVPPGPLSLEGLGEVIARHRVSTLWATTGLFHQMVEERVTHLRGLRQLLTGGEVLSTTLAKRFLEMVPGCRLYNNYGPTENTTFTTTQPLDRPEDVGRVAAIGRPIADTTVYVVGRRTELVPVGVVGELWTGGDGLARGYWDRPGKTAERFVPHPWSCRPGERLYCSGDLVRWRPDGNLDFVGRRDFQFKIRGFRVELGEVEIALGSLPGVAEAVAVVGQGPTGKRLLGYVALEPAGAAGNGEAAAATVSGTALRDALAERLPPHLVPSAVIVLDELPLSPTGKVDRRALPDVEAAREERTRVAPRTEAEEMVASIWSELLGSGPPSVDDDFFALGGHSLLATRVVSRAVEAFGIEIPLRALFEHPALEDFAARVEALAAAHVSTPAPPLVPVARDGEIPLSFAQLRFWFLHRLDPGSVAYNVPGAVRLEGRLEVGVLGRALEAMVHRHEILRTTYEPGEPEPRQVVAPPGPVALPRVDLPALPAGRREGELGRLLAADARRPFDLRRGPILRLALIRLAEEDHALVVSTHHVASDGWSQGIFLREMGRLYGALAAGEPFPLPPLPVQYADYAAWQRGWLRGEALEERVAWWRDRLAGAPPALELPTDRPRPSSLSQRGRGEAVSLDADLTAALMELGRRHGATLFMTLLAAFQVLLSRWSGQDDVSVGVPVAGRTRAEIEGVLGCFVNTLVQRNVVPPDATFEDFLARVREGALGAQQHQDVPFERLVEELDPERHMDRSPLFQVVFALQNFPRPERRPAPELRLSGLGADPGTEKFDLSLSVAETEGAVEGVFQYSVDLFDATTVRRAARRWITLLRGIVEEPATRLRDLPLLSAAERHQVELEWSDTARNSGGNAWPVGASVVERILGQAERRSGAVAVVAGDDARLTYGELVARARGLAGELTDLGVGAESAVGVLLPRSPDLLVAQLAVMLAGGAYVPLDPSHPPARLRAMLADAGAKALVSDPARMAALEEAAGERVPPWVDPAAAPASPQAEIPAPPDPARLAYVLFTSGSTGRPKGVAMSHGALANLLDWSVSTLGFGPDTRASQVAGLGFDASVWEIWATLAHGGSLHLLPSMETLAPREMARWLRRERLTHGYLPMPVAEALLRSGEAVDLPDLVLLSAGGAQLQRAPVGPLGFDFVNLYGPAETCVNSTFAVVPQDGAAQPPIGRPVDNTGLRVLDRALRPVPIGVTGELYLAGAGLARGYAGRPALTASRFVPDPLAEAGERAYRTGDLVRWLPDGQLDFQGRVDHQVQLRGLRVELGEIEALLVAEPTVAEAVVVPDGPDGLEGEVERLVAYVVAAGETPTPEAGESMAPWTDALRRSLARHLPEYMVPTAWKVLDELPLTPNGKVDRRALPAVAPDATGEAADRQRMAPRDAVELALVQIFEDLLGVPVGVEDDFFALGGHSLLAVQLVSRVEQHQGYNLPLAALFADPTVERLAVRLRSGLEHGAPVDGDASSESGADPRRRLLVPLRRAGGEAPFFCVHPIGGHVFCYLDLVRHLGAERSVYGLQAPAVGDGPAGGLEGLAARYLEEIRRVQGAGPYRLGGWSFGGVVAFEMARQLRAAGETVALLAVFDGQLPGEDLEAPQPLERLYRFGHDLAGLGGVRLDVDADELRRAEAEGRLDSALAELLERARDEGLLPPDLPPAELRRLYRLFDRNLEWLYDYRPGSYDGTVTLFLADGSPAPHRRAERWAAMCDDLQTLPLHGDHYSILREPGVGELAHLLDSLLDPLLDPLQDHPPPLETPMPGGGEPGGTP